MGSPDTEYFFSSFAVNAEGWLMVLYRNLRLYLILSPVSSDATPVIDAPGWVESPWFGTFFMDNRKVDYARRIGMGICLSSGRRHLDVASGDRMDLDQLRGLSIFI